MVQVANELRAQKHRVISWSNCTSKRRIPAFNCIIESVRAPGEADALHHKGEADSLLSVDANRERRDMSASPNGKSETGSISAFETFLENEQRETSSTDPNKQNLSACIAMSDFQLHNEVKL
jgi:hypothetical protein